MKVVNGIRVKDKDATEDAPSKRRDAAQNKARGTASTKDVPPVKPVTSSDVKGDGGGRSATG